MGEVQQLNLENVRRMLHPTRGCKDPEAGRNLCFAGQLEGGGGGKSSESLTPWGMKVVLGFGLKRGLDMNTIEWDYFIFLILIED